MRQWQIPTALAAGLLTVACAAPTVQLGQPMTLEGKLVLKGNAPFVVPVLQTAKGNWELRGLAEQTAARLQNKQLQVSGTVSRLQQGPALPQLQVSSVNEPGLQ
ncbi:hypothetical protein [Jeongeupia chitinilytica]|uniref:DUF5666 domain-containing protein n=1 Tax=Jeongeupia chitinilytica TaxID=1041641 RepID=A0ABQ3H3W5_9NEIS|nr:hypothetical protein [Jeongeupia chitinilytica]GHD68345.1 hypothetical protein GCM10007350_33380 [Jeongeupia chitinilytica]